MNPNVATWAALAGGDTLTFCTTIPGSSPNRADFDEALEVIRNEIASWPKYSRTGASIPPVLGLQLVSVLPLLPAATFQREDT